MAGLSRGDVILAYDEQPTEKYEALVEQLQAVGKAIEGGDRGSDDMIALRYWRDGKELETKVAPGKLGVQLDRRPPKDGLELIVMQTRGEEAAIANVSMLDQIRLHGGSLPPLPGTAREAEAIARVIKTASGTATLLKGESATIGRLESNAGGKRILHIATHGLTGSQERPYDASLALTQPGNTQPR
ncbi:MAG: CHAT domain-containing protein [Planctomycetes bacterium]|nr:CHAT domain-containing protein [Planctomycetota bacterium]